MKVGEIWNDWPITDLQSGDVFLVCSKERMPTDAKVASGSSDVDECMITGEAMPIAKAMGDPVTSGTVDGLGSSTCELCALETTPRCRKSFG